MFPLCGNCGIRHDPRQPTCNREDRIAYAREKAGLPPLIPVIEAKSVNANKPADKAQRIVKARAVVDKKQIVHAVVHAVVHDQPVVHESKHGKYADAEKRKSYRAEWMKQDRLKRKSDKQKAQSKTV